VGSAGLLDQLGGNAQIKALSDAFVNSAASDPRSSKLLSGANLGTLKSKVSDQFCGTLGGGCTAPLTSTQVRRPPGRSTHRRRARSPTAS